MFLTEMTAKMSKIDTSGSQSPQIGSMFLTQKISARRKPYGFMLGRNPLKSGQCFLPRISMDSSTTGSGKSGVAIPSNRVNVSYTELIESLLYGNEECRNPLKSGQCFLRKRFFQRLDLVGTGRNPLKSGQCFLPVPLC